MDKSDIWIITKTAAVTVAAAVLLTAAGVAVSVDGPVTPAQFNTIDGCKLSANVYPTDRPEQVRVVVRAESSAAEDKTLDLRVRLERVQFTGDPLSRTVGPTDTTRETESSEDIRLKAPAGGTGEYELLLDRKVPDQPKATEENTPAAPAFVMPATWEITAQVGEQTFNLAAFNDASLQEQH